MNNETCRTSANGEETNLGSSARCPISVMTPGFGSVISDVRNSLFDYSERRAENEGSE